MANLSSFGAGMLGGAGVQIVISAVDDFSSTFKKSTTATEKLGKALKVAALGTAAGFAYMATQASKFERTQAAFSTMLNSTERANKLLKELAEFTKKTPFQLEELEDNSRLLLGMGIEVDRLIPTMKSLGDVASALNIPFERVALNFGQVKAQGKLMGTELRDFARAGIPIIAELAKNLNVSEAAIKEMSSAGKISFADVEEAFRTMSSEGGQFNDFMSKAMDTTSGKISNFQDSVKQLSRAMGEFLLPKINQVVGGLTDMVNKFNELDPKTKELVSKIAVGTGVGIIGAGVVAKGIEIYSNIRGTSPATPMYTFEVNPAAQGGDIVGKGVSKGASLLSNIAVGLIAEEVARKLGTKLIMNYLEKKQMHTSTGVIEGVAQLDISKQTEKTEEEIKKMFQFKNPFIKATEDQIKDVLPAIEEYSSLQELTKNLTTDQSTELINYIETIRNANTEQEKLTSQLNNGEISTLEYSIKQSILNAEIDAAAQSANSAITGLEGFREEITKIATMTAVDASMQTRLKSGAMSEGTYNSLVKAGLISGSTKFTTGGDLGITSSGGAFGSFNDFIMRPGQGAASFSPDDTIIGVKDTSMLGGRSINVSIENIYGTDPDEIAEALQMKLRNMVSV